MVVTEMLVMMVMILHLSEDMMMMIMLIISRIMLIIMMFVWVRLVIMLIGNLNLDNDDDQTREMYLHVAPTLHLGKTTLVQKVTGLVRGL